jgi:hypothetical protein
MAITETTDLDNDSRKPRKVPAALLISRVCGAILAILSFGIAIWVSRRPHPEAKYGNSVEAKIGPLVYKLAWFGPPVCRLLRLNV